MEILNELKKISDYEYAEFQSKLITNIKRGSIIGVRVPVLRKFSKDLIKECKNLKKSGDDTLCLEIEKFMGNLPHDYFDENMLHSLMISEMTDVEECFKKLEKFLPYIDNWAVCDILSPKIFKKNREILLEKIREYSLSKHTYTVRFGIGMLMSHFLDEDFKSEYLEIPASVKSDEYYVNMMIAWFYATALAKKWNETIVYLKNNRLDVWTHNKTIQKARESRRITSEQKEFLKSLKR